MTQSKAHQLIGVAREVAGLAVNVAVIAGSAHEDGDPNEQQRDGLLVQAERIEALGASIKRIVGGQP